MKLSENAFLFHASFYASLLSNPNLSKLTAIQPVPLQNLSSSKFLPWKFVRKFRPSLLKKCQNNFYMEFFEVVQRNRLQLFLYLAFTLFFCAAARIIAPPFKLNFHISLFLMAKDNHERPAFGIFLKRQRS